MRLSVAVSLALLVQACGGGSVPISPTPPTQASSPDATFTVSGVVFGQGNVPVAGARVGIANQQGTTDGSGTFSLRGVHRSYGTAYAVKEGFAAAREILTVDRDMHFDFHLGPRLAIHTLSGVVLETTPTGLVPIEGVQMSAYSCEDTAAIPPFYPAGSCGFASISQSTTTDRNGSYRFTGLYSGKRNSLGATKEGFVDPRVDPDAQEGSGREGKGQEVVIDGDTRIDLYLIRR
jgi:hypothetical protein